MDFIFRFIFIPFNVFTISITCAAASSYPVVPFICPAKYNPFIRLVSNVGFNSLGST